MNLKWDLEFKMGFLGFQGNLSNVLLAIVIIILSPFVFTWMSVLDLIEEIERGENRVMPSKERVFFYLCGVYSTLVGIFGILAVIYGSYLFLT